MTCHGIVSNHGHKFLISIHQDARSSVVTSAPLDEGEAMIKSTAQIPKHLCSGLCRFFYALLDTGMFSAQPLEINPIEQEQTAI